MDCLATVINYYHKNHPCECLGPFAFMLLSANSENFAAEQYSCCMGFGCIPKATITRSLNLMEVSLTFAFNCCSFESLFDWNAPSTHTNFIWNSVSSDCF